MTNQWQKKAKQAQKKVDAAMTEQIVKLSSLNASSINDLLVEHSMNKDDFNQLIKLIKDQTKSNNDKIKALSNMQNGLALLVGLVGKLI